MWLGEYGKKAVPQPSIKRLCRPLTSRPRFRPRASAVILGGARPVDDLPGFAEGDVSVQDAAAQIAARCSCSTDIAAGFSTRVRIREARAGISSNWVGTISI